MTVPYLARLACLSLACYFLLHTALASAAWAFLGGGRGWPTDASAGCPRGSCWRCGLLPAGLALAAVVALLVPSFLWLEPAETVEEAGAACLGGDLLGAAVWMAALARGLRAAALLSGAIPA